MYKKESGRSPPELNFRDLTPANNPISKNEIPLSPTDYMVSPCSKALLLKGRGRNVRKTALNNALQQNAKHASMLSSRFQSEEEIRDPSVSSADYSISPTPVFTPVNRKMSRDSSLSPPSPLDDQESIFALPIRPKPKCARDLPMTLVCTSEKTRQVLQEAGWVFSEVIAEPETPDYILGGDAFEACIRLAKGYLQKARDQCPKGSLVVSAAQLTQGGFSRYPDTNYLPHSKIEARSLLLKYSEAKMKTISAVAVMNTDNGVEVDGVEIASVYFDEFSDDTIERILEREETMQCPGAFNINDPDIRQTVNRIEGDIDCVFGLPLNLLSGLLELSI